MAEPRPAFNDADYASRPVAESSAAMDGASDIRDYAIGHWSGDAAGVSFAPLSSEQIRSSTRQPIHVVLDPRQRAVGLAVAGSIGTSAIAESHASYPLLGTLSPLYPEWLGDRRFREQHDLRFAYMGGAMARGIATTDLVVSLARAGGIGMFGAAGLSPEQVSAAIDRLESALGSTGLPWGCNLIHSPNERGLEDAIVDLYLRRGVRRVEASAYMQVNAAVVRYACSGLRRAPDDTVVRKNHLFAKVSREEVAQQFMAPAPSALLDGLVNDDLLSADEAALARQVPLAEQVTVESDSGGHTDNRPLTALLPAILRLRDQLCETHGYARPIHVGAAGGLGTPEAIAGAFAMGAAYVVLGSVHQAAVESGVSDDSRAMLAEAGPADVAMTAAADMFEMGVKVQVLTRGTMMAVRGNRLYDVYCRHESLEDIPARERTSLEKHVFRTSIDDIWEQTRAFFAENDEAQIERAERDPKHRMALTFRWYLGQSSRWPMVGERDRQSDYQLWCGPAMGAFNRWVRGTFLEAPDERYVDQIMLNLLEGAATVTRAQQYRSYGLDIPAKSFHFRPERRRIA